MALTYVKDNRTLDIKGVITLRDGTQKQITASDIISYRVSESIGGQALGLGTAESASFTLTLNNSDRTYSESDLDNAEVHMYIGLQTNGTIAYSDLGVWYVQNTRASEQSTSVEITGNDALSILFNAEYVDSESVYPTTIGSLATAACAAAGISLKSNSFANAAVSVTAMPKWKAKVTLRDIVGYCAACAGGFARISRDGELEICSYMDGAQHSLSPSSYMSYSARGGASFKFNAIEVKFSSDDDEFSRYAVNASIADNATNTIQIEGNPLMTSTIVQSIVNEFKGLNAAPMELSWIGDPDVHCGDRVVLTDTRGSTHTSIINSQTLTFDGGFSMDSKCSLPNLTSTRGASYTTSGNLMDADGNIYATRISGLDKSVVSATTGHFENLTAETITTDQLLASIIEVIKLRAENIDASSINTDSLTAAVASIIEATIKKINAGVITSDELIANIGTIVALKANSITADTIQTDALAAALGRFVSLYAGTGEFDLATIQNLLSNALILQEGVADSMMITNLAVTSANLLNATIDKLVLRGSDGKYYRVFIGAHGTIQTEEVTVTAGEISAGETSDGRQIVATTANVGSLNATTVKASQAIIGTIFTESLTAGKITANEALIASMTAPLLYTTAITALGNSLDLSANESIRLTVGSSLATATVEYALSDSRTEAPTTGWSATAPEWTDGKYMWQRTTWTKRDGTKTVSDPTCIAGATGAKGEQGIQGIQGEQGEKGVPGTNGNDGKTTYFHIKYSAVANPTSASQMTETPSTYIGTYVDFLPDDSSNPAAYTWSRFEGIQGEQGEKGIPGTNGTDGKTSYLHIAYANSADGATDFSTTDSTDKLYIGQYTDFEPLDSTDPTDYAWTRIKGEQGLQGEKGVPGANGTDGKTTYFHIKYAPVQNPTASQMTETPDVYIGTYVDFLPDDSTNPSDYTWARFEGAQGEKGIPGTNGNDGKTYYLHIAYATSADGSTGFSTTESSGKTYIGTCTDENPDDPTTPASYKWSLTKGEDGTGIASVTAEYYLSTSKDEPTGGEWLDTPPTWTTGKYMWTRTKITYKNPPSTEYTEPVCDSTWEITNGLKDDIDAVSNAAETALGLAEVAQDAANGAQETANGAQESANQANERASILETQLTLTQEGLSIVRTETIPGLEGRVETIESGVHIEGSEIGIYTSDSPFRNTITNNGWVISEDGAPIITCAETKLTAPRIMVSDAFIIGGLAWKPGTDKHVRLLKYGRLS